jgi:1-aminocyclopropane-1-carboxylate deaminase/D-cysteine desulfhydrase-like pyridoxal-dependent ACC family enzyme
VVLLVREEGLAYPGLPNGKLRGVVPYVEALRDEYGVTGIVNAGGSRSNSHAIAAYAGRALGLPVVTVVNTHRPTPWTDLAADMGAEVIVSGVTHLGPCRYLARAVAQERRWSLLPWGFAHPDIVALQAATVANLSDAEAAVDLHVVPVGSGGYAAAIATGLVRYGLPGRVLGVGVMPKANTEARLRSLASPAASARLDYAPAAGRPLPTPFASDPHYEPLAWPAALAAAATQTVLFWCVGQALLFKVPG